MNTKHDTTARGPGRPALPADEVLGDGHGGRVSVRLNARDTVTLRQLADALGKETRSAFVAGAHLRQLHTGEALQVLAPDRHRQQTSDAEHHHSRNPA